MRADVSERLAALLKAEPGGELASSIDRFVKFAEGYYALNSKYAHKISPSSTITAIENIVSACKKLEVNLQKIENSSRIIMELVPNGADYATMTYAIEDLRERAESLLRSDVQRAAHDDRPRGRLMDLLMFFDTAVFYKTAHVMSSSPKSVFFRSVELLFEHLDVPYKDFSRLIDDAIARHPPLPRLPLQDKTEQDARFCPPDR